VAEITTVGFHLASTSVNDSHRNFVFPIHEHNELCDQRTTQETEVSELVKLRKRPLNLFSLFRVRSLAAVHDNINQAGIQFIFFARFFLL